MQIVNKSLTNSIWIAFIYISGMIVLYLANALISNTYGSEGIGIYSISSRILSLLTMTALVGTNITIVRNVSKLNPKLSLKSIRDFYDLAITRVFFLSLILSTIFYLFSTFLANDLFENKNYGSRFKIIALLIPLSAISDINKDFLRGVRLFSLSEFLRNIITPLTIIMTILVSIKISHYFLLTPVLGLALGTVIISIFSYFFIITNYEKSQKNLDTKAKNKFFNTSFKIFQGQFIILLSSQLTLYFLEIFSTTNKVGFFHVHDKVASLCTLPLIISNVMMGPKISQLFENQKNKLQKALHTNAKIIFTFSLIIGLLIVTMSSTILNFFGEEFNQNKIILYIIILSQIFNVFCGPSTIFLQMTGNEAVLRRNLFIVLIFSIFSNYILIINFDLLGASIALTTNVILLNILNVIYAKRITGFQTFFNPMKKYNDK